MKNDKSFFMEAYISSVITQNCILLWHVKWYPFEELMTSDAFSADCSFFSTMGKKSTFWGAKWDVRKVLLWSTVLIGSSYRHCKFHLLIQVILYKQFSTNSEYIPHIYKGSNCSFPFYTTWSMYTVQEKTSETSWKINLFVKYHMLFNIVKNSSELVS